MSDTVVESIPQEVRSRRAFVKAAVTLAIVVASAAFGLAGGSHWLEVLMRLGPFLVIVAALGGYDAYPLSGLSLARCRALKWQSASNLQRQKRRGSRMSLRRWFVRYALSALFLWGAYFVATGPMGNNLWWVVLGPVALAAFQAWEVTLLAIGIGMLVAVFHGIAALPVSAAIVIGAVIIASALQGRK